MTQTFQHLTRETLEEHRQIHFYLDQIAVTLEGLKQGLSDVEPMRRLAAQIEGLKERLVEHHQAEEQGGLFQAILEVMPERRVEISRALVVTDLSDVGAAPLLSQVRIFLSALGENVEWLEVPYSSLPDGRTDNTEFSNRLLVESGSNNTFIKNLLGLSVAMNDKFAMKFGFEYP